MSLAPLNVLLSGPNWVTGGHSRPTSSVIGYNWGKTWAEIMSRTSSTHPRLFFSLAALWFLLVLHKWPSVWAIVLLGYNVAPTSTKRTKNSYNYKIYFYLSSECPMYCIKLSLDGNYYWRTKRALSLVLRKIKVRWAACEIGPEVTARPRLIWFLALIANYWNLETCVMLYCRKIAKNKKA